MPRLIDPPQPHLEPQFHHLMRRDHLIDQRLLLLQSDQRLQSAIRIGLFRIIVVDFRDHIELPIRPINFLLQTAAVKFVVNPKDVRRSKAGSIAQRRLQLLVAVEIRVLLPFEHLQIIERLFAIARALLQLDHRHVVAQRADQFRRKARVIGHLDKDAQRVSLILPNDLRNVVDDRLVGARVIRGLVFGALQVDHHRAARRLSEHILEILFAVAVVINLEKTGDAPADQALVVIERVDQRKHHFHRRGMHAGGDFVVDGHPVEFRSIVFGRKNSLELVEESLIGHEPLHRGDGLFVIHLFDRANRLRDAE